MNRVKEKLIWNVYIENNGKIELYNILKHGSVKEFLTKTRKEYKKGVKSYSTTYSYTFKDYDGSIIFIPETLAGKSFDEVFKSGVFERRFRHLLQYSFWAKCEWEIILTDWPTKIEDGELEVAKKIDVYSQIISNWKPFIDYIWDNLLNADLR